MKLYRGINGDDPGVSTVGVSSWTPMRQVAELYARVASHDGETPNEDPAVFEADMPSGARIYALSDFPDFPAWVVANQQLLQEGLFQAGFDVIIYIEEVPELGLRSPTYRPLRDILRNVGRIQ